MQILKMFFDDFVTNDNQNGLIGIKLIIYLQMYNIYTKVIINECLLIIMFVDV